ncbi:MAG: winged helix-turn-helix domain-containing protein [Candidatus Altiarchaeota archaeon]
MGQGLGSFFGLRMMRRAVRIQASIAGGRMKGDDKLRHGKAGHGLPAALKEYAKSRGIKVSDIELKTLVGEAAGELYLELDGRGEVSLKDMRARFEGRGPVMMAALGWLMREDKVDVVIGEDSITARLK